MMKFNFTKDRAIAEHRKMWCWIYNETVKQKRPVSKEEYLEKNNIFGLHSDCFLCEYSINETIKNGADSHMCGCCPLDWDSKAKNKCKCVRKVNFEPKTNKDFVIAEHRKMWNAIADIGSKIFAKLFTGYYYRWNEASRKGDYKAAAKYAYKIANLKEKKNEMRNPR